VKEKRDIKLWEVADKYGSYDFCLHSWSRAEVCGQEYQDVDLTLADTFSEVPQRAFELPLAVHKGLRESEDDMELVFEGKRIQGLGPQ